MSSTNYSELGNRGQLLLTAVSSSNFGNFPSTILEQASIPGDEIVLNIDEYRSSLDVRVPYNLQGDDLGLYFFGMLGKQLFHDSVFRDLIRVNTIFLFVFLLWLSSQLKRITKVRNQVFCLVVASVPISLFFANEYFGGYGALLNPWEGYLWVALAPFSLLFNKGKSKSDLTMNLIGILFFVIFCSIRNSVTIFLIPLLLIEVWKCSKWLIGREWVKFRANPIRILPGLMTGISTVAFPKALHLLTTESFRENYGSGHLVWHSIWCFLDIGNRSMPFKMSDSAASLRALELDPDTVFATSQYDLILKSDVLNNLKMHPGYILEVLAHKSELILGPMVVAALLTLVLLLIYRYMNLENGLLQLILIATSYTFTILIILITWPSINYAFPLFFGIVYQTFLVTLLGLKLFSGFGIKRR